MDLLEDEAIIGPEEEDEAIIGPEEEDEAGEEKVQVFLYLVALI